MSYQQLTKLVKRAAHTRTVYLFLYSAGVAVWLYFNNRTVLFVHADYFVLGLGSLVLLAIWEPRQDIPLPFMNRLTCRQFLLTVALALGLPILVDFWDLIVLEQEVPFTSTNAIICYCLARYASVRILEESYKLGLTNAGAMLFYRVFRTKLSEKLNRIGLVIIGAIPVGFWASRHLYGFKADAVIFVSGMIYFALILWKKNYLPIVTAHTLNDWAVLFLSLELRPICF